MTAESQPAHGTTSLEGRLAMNLCALHPWVIAADSFNTDPQPLHLAGVREANHHFFSQLDGMEHPMQRGQAFHDYLDVTFALHQWQQYEGRARSSLRNSYIRFLCGWGMESNSIEGAVMKSWVQSRFGVVPTYHRGVLQHRDGEEDDRFARDRMKGSSRTNAIYSQFDLLYEFCQYELSRRWPERRTLVLFRGTNDPEEHPVREVRAKRELCVRLNNLVSFTANHERAWEFGSTVWKATVACSKIIFFSGLLPDSFLRGEDEYLLIGGDYWVRELLY